MESLRSRLAGLGPASVLTLALIAGGCERPAPPASRVFNVTIATVPTTVYTVTQGAQYAPSASGAWAQTQNLTWLFHLVFSSKEATPLRIESAEATFLRGGTPIWRETFERPYLERLEWIQGEFSQTAEYYLTRTMTQTEEAGSPDLPANGALSWVRIPFGRPWFARVDQIAWRFRLRGPDGAAGEIAHTIPVVEPQQKTTLRLPFEGVWVPNAGNDLSTGHRRGGLNNLTTYGWDFVKLGENGTAFRTTGKDPKDYYTYDQPVLAAADGTVVEMRHDIPDYGIREDPPAEMMRRDGDVFAGNLVTLDHGSGEYSLTCHMRPGTVTVKIGDRVKAGQLLGRAGNSGNSGVPHIHFNLMNSPKWLQAAGLPGLFTDVERIVTGGPPQRLALANPMSGWFVRNATNRPD